MIIYHASDVKTEVRLELRNQIFKVLTPQRGSKVQGSKVQRFKVGGKN
jgi:Spy/CpxP family protein refolding chaperone